MGAGYGIGFAIGSQAQTQQRSDIVVSPFAGRCPPTSCADRATLRGRCGASLHGSRSRMRCRKSSHALGWPGRWLLVLAMLPRVAVDYRERGRDKIRASRSCCGKLISASVFRIAKLRSANEPYCFDQRCSVVPLPSIGSGASLRFRTAPCRRHGGQESAGCSPARRLQKLRRLPMPLKLPLDPGPALRPSFGRCAAPCPSLRRPLPSAPVLATPRVGGVAAIIPAKSSVNMYNSVSNERRISDFTHLKTRRYYV